MDVSSLGNAGRSITGVLGAQGATLTLVAPGASNYLISITPGSPNLVATFAVADMTTGGGRRLFKTGVGALEVVSEKLDGTQPTLEYRVAGGGDGLTITLSAWTSGSATFRIQASSDPCMVLINGSVHTTEQASVRGGRSFKMSTGLVSVAANNFLQFSLMNPVGSGRNVFVTRRTFQQTGTTVLTYQQRVNPGVISGGTAIAIVNRRNDSAVTAVSVASYLMTTAALSTGTLGPSGCLAPNGERDYADILDMLAPGSSLGYSFAGVGGGITAAAQIVGTFVIEEEGIV